MKFTTCVLILCLVALVNSEAECPDDQYNPGPNCGFENRCPPGNVHGHRPHQCDCWCKPPRVRYPPTNACIEPEKCTYY